MKTYDVSIPTTGVVHVTVDVPDDADEDAIFEVAVDEYAADEANGEHCWEFQRHITTGNVLHAEQNDWEYTEQKR